MWALKTEETLRLQGETIAHLQGQLSQALRDLQEVVDELRELRRKYITGAERESRAYDKRTMGKATAGKMMIDLEESDIGMQSHVCKLFLSRNTSSFAE